METGGPSAVAVRKVTITPKAIIYQKFGSDACYKVEEVEEPPQIDCPRLVIPQKGPRLYCCHLQLPEFSVVSKSFKKKKDAEQSAAEMALEKLGIKPTTDSSSVVDVWDGLISRVSHLFSDEFLPSLHPLGGHFRAALQRDDDLYGSIPVSVMAVCDAKLSNICRLIDPKADSNLFMIISLIMRAAAKLSESVVSSNGQLSIKRKNPYPTEIIESSAIEKSVSPEITLVEALYVPYLLEKTVQPVTLNLSSSGYYLDVIAQKLGLTEANKVLVSRNIGKTSSETRVYFAAPEPFLSDLSSDHLNVKFHSEGSLNARASYICGQDIYGDAIMASVGYTWRSKDLLMEDMSLQLYYRTLIGKTPSGIYKLSREAILIAELPSVFSTKTNWKGSFPKEILCMFCRQHQLSEPVFSFLNVPSKSVSESSRSLKKLKVIEPAEDEIELSQSLRSESSFRCEVKIFSKSQDLLIQCSPKQIYKKQGDSAHNVSLKVLTWLNAYFRDTGIPLEKLNQCADALDIRFCTKNFLKVFVLCRPVPHVEKGEIQGVCHVSKDNVAGSGVCTLNIEGRDSGVCPSSGSLLCISYSVFLTAEGENVNVLLESNDEFEFEMGNGTVIPQLETVVTQMSTGQSACFKTKLPSQELILGAAADSTTTLSLLDSKICCLEYRITIVRITEPQEERMERALFSPPLSNQRVEYAVQRIKESCATTLVDFGCGSGSLLDSLLGYTTSLEKIVGIDISQKALSRAAKILHTKLGTKSVAEVPCIGIKSAVLYDGSITDFDSRLLGFDIGTCLEVIEHMEEDLAYLFGVVVLSSFRPKILIVSTPNYEYNAILQGSNNGGQEEDPEEKPSSQAPKFRNHDHKFEWTREQFNQWASELAKMNGYTVEFSGVGGSGDVEPGFASQIALFRRLQSQEDDSLHKDAAECYKIIWEWNRE
ncbi:small RNA 2'-O-methyltransferase-like [Tripterygium wilfordii]|uniref:Small RNA 2'-O-methyltransferase n=1 Tax=Tripterygium wilfordii TaxID=458696 RepID=A0A7J7D7W7_TRIWF|nr:small RNA 2'-O-methyltransferase-like [Tripterygium wilfordii]XP_038710463.1 small RNA 2'-O-methyltransferase-like [Tripterygium wilfordii]KAF5742423.1 small RNA 2'-O-methyltransferase-like [Tripterygium wilfordii]